MLLWIARNSAIEIRGQFNSAFRCVIDGRKAIDQLPELLEAAVLFPLDRRFRKEFRVEIAKLRILNLKNDYLLLLM